MRRMDFAASLILENRMEIIDICQECGFRNLSYFTRFSSGGMGVRRENSCGRTGRAGGSERQ